MKSLYEEVYENPADNYELLLSEHEHDVHEGRLHTLLTVYQIVRIMAQMEDKCLLLPRSGS